MSINAHIASNISSTSLPTQEADEEKHESATVLEEDWSEFMGGHNFQPHENDDHDADSNFFGFSSHDDCRQIPLPASSSSSSSDFSLAICCASSLSPMDMMNMSNGADDPTGHVIWKGALMFIEALPISLLNGSSLKERCFDRKRILELGCGTGVAGIAATIACRPKLSVLTDGNEDALKLVRHNCRINGLRPISKSTSMKRVKESESSNKLIAECQPNSDCYVFPLKWGSSDQINTKQLNPKVGTIEDETELDKKSSLISKASFDTVMATDVLYDLAALSPLLETTNYLLKGGGTFVLSHIPRAALPPDEDNQDPIISVDSHSISPLEGYIIGKVTSGCHAMMLDYIIRPSDVISAKDGANDLSEGTTPSIADCEKKKWTELEEMRDAGAALLVFSKPN